MQGVVAKEKDELDEEIEKQERMQNVLEAFDTTVRKLRTWAEECVKAAGATEDELYKLRKALDHDSLLYADKIRLFLAKHKEILAGPAWEDGTKIKFFWSLMPEQYRHLKFSEEVGAKGLLYVRVFQSIFRDLDQ